EYNPAVSAALGRLAAAARAGQDVLETEARRLLAAAGGVDGLDRALLRSAPPALRRLAIQEAVVALLGDAQGFSERHWAALDRATEGPAGARLDLPRSVVADVLPDSLRLRPGRDVNNLPPIEGALEIPVPGGGSIGAWRFAAAAEPLPGVPLVAAVDAT